MSTSADPTLRTKYFSHLWTITAPSHPNFKIIRATPAHLDVWIPLLIDPENNVFQDTADKVWDEEAIELFKKGVTNRYYGESAGSETRLEGLVYLDDIAVGYGGLYGMPAEGDVGIILSKKARGKGIGKLTLQIFAQIAFDLNIPCGSGTMKANLPMRGLMKSLGVPEKEVRVEIPGRGVVAEIGYTIKPEDWKRVDMKVEFEKE